MGMMSELESPQEEMIRQQIVARGIENPAVLAALRAVPRELFFEREQRVEAFADQPSPIGLGQTISQPYIVALMTDRLEVGPGHRVLEVGTGSGYQTALLARLASQVYTIERHKPLLDKAWERLMRLDLRNVRFKHGDGSVGWPEAGPFDRVLISAGAPALPEALLKEHLVDGGLAVLPVGPMDRQILVRVRRKGSGLESTDICRCRFVKLIGKFAWAEEQ